MPETLYSAGGEFVQDDPLHILTAADQAAAQFLKILDDLDNDPLDRLRNNIYPQFSNQIISLAEDRELAWWAAASFEDRFRQRDRLYPDESPETEILIKEQQLWRDCLDKISIKPKVDLLQEAMTDAFSSLAQWISELNIWCRPIVRLLLETLGDWKYLKPKSIQCTTCRWGHRIEYFSDAARETKEWDLPIPLIGVVPTLWSTNPFHCEIRGHWNPFDETRERAEKRLIDEFLKKLTEYLDQTEQLAAEEGTAAPRKRNPEAHFEWLIRYQVHGWGYNKIARHYHCDRTTATHGIKTTAALLPLELVSKSGGRPSGIKETYKRHIAR